MKLKWRKTECDSWNAVYKDFEFHIHEAPGRFFYAVFDTWESGSWDLLSDAKRMCQRLVDKMEGK